MSGQRGRLDRLAAAFPPAHDGDTCLPCAGPGGYRRLNERLRLGLLTPGPCAVCAGPNYAAALEREHQHAQELLRAAGYPEAEPWRDTGDERPQP